MFNWDAAAQHLTEEVVEDDSNREVVLVVDDEETNRVLLKGILATDYRVVAACDGDDAIAKLGKETFSAIVCDHRMPGMTGVEFFTELQRRGHDATRIILTGYAELQSIITAINDAGIFRYLTKPVETDTLRQTVREGVHLFQIRQENARLMNLVKGLLEEKSELIKELELEGVSFDPQLSSHIELGEPRKANVAVMFVDIQGLSDFSESVSAMTLMSTLQVVFSRIHQIIYDAGGIVDKHLGDGLMAVFGLESGSLPEHATVAMRKIIESFESIRLEVEDETFHQAKLLAGAASGEVVLGMLGTDKRSELAIIGQTANLAARLQEFSKVALLPGDGKRILGDFDVAMGLCCDALIADSADVRVVSLEGLKVRDFADLDEVGVFSR